MNIKKVKQYLSEVLDTPVYWSSTRMTPWDAFAESYLGKWITFAAGFMRGGVGFTVEITLYETLTGHYELIVSPVNELAGEDYILTCAAVSSPDLVGLAGALFQAVNDLEYPVEQFLTRIGGEQ